MEGTPYIDKRIKVSNFTSFWVEMDEVHLIFYVGILICFADRLIASRGLWFCSQIIEGGCLRLTLARWLPSDGGSASAFSSWSIRSSSLFKTVLVISQTSTHSHQSSWPIRINTLIQSLFVATNAIIAAPCQAISLYIASSTNQGTIHSDSTSPATSLPSCSMPSASQDLLPSSSSECRGALI